MNKQKKLLTIHEICLFAVLGALMFCSKLIMELLPNIHLLGMFTMAYTVTYRKKALIPIYVYVFINGLWAGFATWWIPYLYLWTVLWAITMLIPRNLSKKSRCVVYPVVCALHGISFGTLYAPLQALLFGLNFKQMIAWIVLGLKWDAVHGVGNFFAGMLVLPISEILKKLTKKAI